MHQVIISITRESEPLQVTHADGTVSTLHPDSTSQIVTQWEHGETVSLSPVPLAAPVGSDPAA